MFISNQPRIAMESIDGETIIIDFETGLYYSARNEAYLILELILSGFSPDEIITSCIQFSNKPVETIKPLIDDFIASLVDAQILIPASDGIPSPAKQELDARHLNHPIWFSGSFNPPVLESFKDMQEILLMDPIHDTNTKGWPEKK